MERNRAGMKEILFVLDIPVFSKIDLILQLERDNKQEARGPSRSPTVQSKKYTFGRSELYQEYCIILETLNEVSECNILFCTLSHYKICRNELFKMYELIQGV